MEVAQRLVLPFDYLFVAIVVFMTALGVSQFPIFLVALAVPLLFPLFGATAVPWKSWNRTDGLYVLLMLQYPIFHYFVARAYPPVNEPLPVRMLELPLAWIYWIIIILVMFWRVSGTDKLQATWRHAGPWALTGVFLFFTLDYFTDYFGDECRTTGLVCNPIVPPVFYSMFAIASFVGWGQFTRNERIMRYVIMFMAVVLASAYSGSRMIVLVQMACFGVLSLTLPVGNWAERFRLTGVMALIGFSALGGGILIDYLMQFGFGEKFLTLIAAILSMDSTQGVSINARAILFERGIGPAIAQPWTGYGIAYEKILSDPYYHIHNQYLSWMLWAGTASLISGLLFVLAPAISSIRQTGRDGVIIAIATSLVLILNSFTDSLLYHEIFMVQFLITVVFIQALGRAKPKVEKR